MIERPMQPLSRFAERVTTTTRPVTGAVDIAIQEIRVSFTRAVPGRLPAGVLASTYTSKPLIQIGEEQLFGELAVLRLLEQDGWHGVWVDTFHSRGSRKLFWTDMPHRSAPFDMAQAPRADRLYRDIVAARGGKAWGFFDVMAWRGDDLVFVEYKGPGDSPNANEPHWLAAALACGVRPEQLFCVCASFTSNVTADAGEGVATKRAPRTEGRAQAAPASTPEVTVSNAHVASMPRSGWREPVHRRTISGALQRTYGWTVRTNVDGYVEVTPPRDRMTDESFASEVKAAVVALGYQPTVGWYRDKQGVRLVRLRTPETIAQVDRGRHRT